MHAFLSVAALFAALTATPAAAATFAPAQQESARPDTAESVGLFMDHFYRGEFDQALTTVSAIEVDPSNKAGRGLVLGMRSAALLGLNRKNEALAAFKEADALAPDEPLISSLQMMAGLMTSDGDIALAALDRMIARFPDYVREIDQEIIWFAFREEKDTDKVRNQDRRIALARLGYGGEVRGDYIAASAIQALVGRGDAAGALEMLRYLDQPVEIENLLIQKRYASIWPAVEEHAGAALGKVRNSSVQAAQRAYEADPSDWEKLADLANAYRYAERFDDAVALQSKLPLTPEALGKAKEQGGWAINNVALAMHSAGKADEADRLFATLNEARVENAGWRVSMVINRLELLVADQRYDRAAALLDITEATAKSDGNPYAQQLVRRLRYCTLTKLGRKDEAARLKLDVIKHLDDARGPTIDGLLCAGDYDDAEKAILDGLKGEDFAESFVRSMQRQPLIADDPSIWSAGWAVMRRRPAIAAEFDRLGRDMPAQLRARTPVDQPAAASSSGMRM